jgi:hypothetical protein
MFDIDTVGENFNEQECFFVESVKELEKVNKQLAKLLFRKEELTAGIINALDHTHEGQKSYEYGIWKIEVKTPFVYSLNKKIYESGDIKLPNEFNPIKESKSYTVDKRLCDKYMSEAPKKVRDALAELIDKKPGKAGITIKERI